MKYLTVCRGALLALSLAVVSTSASAGDYGRNDCYKCPPPRNYDSQEVVKKTRDVDHTRVIETQSVVPSKRLIETNHLIIHENETSQRWYDSAQSYHRREGARPDQAER